MAQDLTDAIRYSNDNIYGTARYRGVSGAFGALGGDLSAISVNPASSAVFTTSYFGISLSNLNTDNDVSYFDGNSSSSDSNFDFNQGGAVFIFNNYSQNSPWKKMALAINYDQVSDFDNDWVAHGTNTNSNLNLTNSIASYFLTYANGLRLDEISAFPGESYSEAYAEIGTYYGYGNQQAFLGYESYILEPVNDTDNNTSYTSNIAAGDFNHRYNYVANGYSGKLSFNLATQYEDNFYFGLNINTHFFDYDRFTALRETNNNAGSTINSVYFENILSTTGSGISFQLGGIAKLTNNLRLGLTYNTPTWYKINDETTQYISTSGTESTIVNPNIINVFEEYKLKTPGKITGSLAYVFGKKGFLSFDYSRKDYSNIKFKPTSDSYFSEQNNIIQNNLKAASTYKIGGEYRLKQWSFRGGYRFEESPYEDDNFYGDLTGYSLGLGYNFGNARIDLSFDQSQRDYNYQFYNVGLTEAAKIDSKTSNIVLSFGLNL